MRKLLIILTLLLFWSGCSIFVGGSDNEKKKAVQEQDKIPDSIIKKFVRRAYDGKGVLKWVLKSREGRFFEKEQKVYLTDFMLLIFQKGKLASRLRARRGILYQRDGRMVAKSKVFLKSVSGRTLETEELYGNRNQKIIYNQVTNRITKEDGTVLVGTHLWAHNDLKIFKLKDARGVISTTNTNSTGTSANKKTNVIVKTNSSKVTNDISLD